MQVMNELLRLTRETGESFAELCRTASYLEALNYNDDEIIAMMRDAKGKVYDKNTNRID